MYHLLPKYYTYLYVNTASFTFEVQWKQSAQEYTLVCGIEDEEEL